MALFEELKSWQPDEPDGEGDGVESVKKAKNLKEAMENPAFQYHLTAPLQPVKQALLDELSDDNLDSDFANRLTQAKELLSVLDKDSSKIFIAPFGQHTEENQTDSACLLWFSQDEDAGTELHIMILSGRTVKSYGSMSYENIYESAEKDLKDIGKLDERTKYIPGIAKLVSLTVKYQKSS